MNTITQTNRFSKERFAAVLKNDMLSIRHIAVIALGIAYSIFIISLLANTLNTFRGEISIGRTVFMLSELFPVTMFLSTTIMASLVMYDASRKSSRINVIMLPALGTEKFLSRIITVIFYGVVVSFAIHMALYLLLLGARYLFEGYAMFRLTALPFGDIGRAVTYHYVDGTTSYSVLNITHLIMLFVWMFTCYILGGFIWKRRSWIITSIIFALTVIIIAFAFNYIRDNISSKTELGLEPTLCIILWIWCISMSALNIYLSYRMQKRIQVVEPKFLFIKRLWKRN